MGFFLNLIYSFFPRVERLLSVKTAQASFDDLLYLRSSCRRIDDRSFVLNTQVDADDRSRIKV